MEPSEAQEPKQEPEMPSWTISGQRDAWLVCKTLDASGLTETLSFNLLSNVGNTIIADAVENIPQAVFEQWHDGFMSKFMPWLAGEMHRREQGSGN